MKIIWSNRALRGMGEAVAYIARDNKKAADALAATLFRSAEQLLVHPHMGRPSTIENVCELIVSRTRYVLIYRLRSDTIEILHVLHMAQDWPTTL